MGLLEIVLLTAGAVIFIASFCIPVKQEKLKEETRNLAAAEVKSLVSEELDAVRGRLTELSEEEMREQIAKSERTMERISNEKIMAVNEYSDTVLDEIHKNHEEVVFLYDMLKNKKDSLSESYEKTEQRLGELLQQIRDSEITVREKLEEITKKQEELKKSAAALKKSRAEANTAAGAPEESEKPHTAGRRKRKTAETPKEAAAQVKTENAAEELKETQETVFQPFVPEKVEAVPKKRRAVKPAKAAETEEAVKPEKNAAFAPENTDVMLMLSGDMEQSGSGNSNERILALHAAGKSNVAIARELGLGIGEVKLVIDLYEGLR